MISIVLSGKFTSNSYGWQIYARKKTKKMKDGFTDDMGGRGDFFGHKNIGTEGEMGALAFMWLMSYNLGDGIYCFFLIEVGVGNRKYFIYFAD